MKNTLLPLLLLALALCACQKGEKTPAPAQENPSAPAAATASEAPANPEPALNLEKLAGAMAEKAKAEPVIDADAVIKEIEAVGTNDFNALMNLLTALSKTTTRGPQVRATFRKLLKYEDPDVREQTLMALEDYQGVAFMLNDMVPLLDDPSEDVRDSAMTTIADYVENRAKFQVLIDALDSKYEDVVENAMFNLGFYTDEDFPTKEEWKAWWAKNKNTFQPE